MQNSSNDSRISMPQSSAEYKLSEVVYTLPLQFRLEFFYLGTDGTAITAAAGRLPFVEPRAHQQGRGKSDDQESDDGLESGGHFLSPASRLRQN